MSVAARSAGFTLVEMLVALVVFGLVSAAGVGMLSSATTTQTAVRERMERVAQLQGARAILQADLSQAVPRATRQAGGQLQRAFVGHGEAGDLLFALTRAGWDNPEHAPRASLQYVEYRLHDGRLERRSRTALDGAVLGEPQLLLEDVQGADMLYRYHGRWQDAWPGGHGEIPEALDLTLLLSGFGPLQQLFLMPGDAS